MKKEIERLEEYRKTVLLKKIKFIILLTLIEFGCMIIFGFINPTLILYIMYVIIVINIKDKKYSFDFKKIFVNKALNNTFENVLYEADKGIPKEKIAETRSINLGDRYTTNDHIICKYQGLDVEISDILIEKRYVDSKNREDYDLIYKGKWMIFEFDRKFVTNLTISEDKSKKIKSDLILNHSLKVEMEDIQFNKIFDIFCNMEKEAFYILTPHMQERLKKINDSIPGKLIFIFYNNKLHIGINNNKDTFEPNIFKKIDEKEIMIDINKEINEIIELVNEIREDKSLFIEG